MISLGTEFGCLVGRIAVQLVSMQLGNKFAGCYVFDPGENTFTIKDGDARIELVSVMT